jgi:hypothetical protein
MTVASEPNWLTICGLIFSLYGVCMLADAVMAGSRWPAGDVQKQIEAAARQRAGSWYAIPILAIGFGMQMVAQFVSVGLTEGIVLALLALAFLCLVYALTADSMAARMAGAAVATAPEQAAARAVQALNGPYLVSEEPRALVASSG